jgi:endonuclease YncB( thermonuclease family)
MKLPQPPSRTRRGLLLATVTVLLALLGFSAQDTERLVSLLRTNQPGLYAVTEFVDGDTIRVDMEGTIEIIRFIGIDTPEKNHPAKPVQCFAQAASKHLREIIGNSDVRLEADPTNSNRDRYDRLLRYVYLPDGTLINAKQIEDGYAFAYLGFPFEKQAEFAALEDTARNQERGLWSACDVILDDGQISTEPA